VYKFKQEFSLVLPTVDVISNKGSYMFIYKTSITNTMISLLNLNYKCIYSYLEA